MHSFTHRKEIILAIVVALPFLALAKEVRWPFGAWQRASQTPILAPQGSGWESAGTFNPTIVAHDGKLVMLYRAQDASGTSRLGYGESTDGIIFMGRPIPLLTTGSDSQNE